MSKLAAYSGQTRRWGLLEGDALQLLARLPENSIDAIVTDPPYGIGITGAAWDAQRIREAAPAASAAEAFERWTNQWATECRRVLKPGGHLVAFGATRTAHRLACGIEDAGLQLRDQLLWLYAQGVPKSRRLPDGRGTALKPAYEPILLTRKPFAGTTAQNLERWGTGTLNIHACRVGPERYWPANLALTHSPDCPVGLIDREASGPSRLFFCAKANRAEREAGCAGLPAVDRPIFSGPASRVRHNHHPTCKPLALMRWLVRLVTPAGGLVLDPFAGSASTGIASVLEGRRFIGIERERDYVDIACARLAHWSKQASA